jgi:hypothetical protein
MEPGDSHKSPPLVPALNHINLVHSASFYFLKTHVNIFLPTTPRCQVAIVILGFPISILDTYFFSPVYATFPAYLVVCDVITLIIFHQEYNL